MIIKSSLDRLGELIKTVLNLRTIIVSYRCERQEKIATEARFAISEHTGLLTVGFKSHYIKYSKVFLFIN